MTETIPTEKENGLDILKSAVDAFICCDKDFFPSINKLLHIILTLPVSVASAERTFSTLRRLKTWLRSQMGEERLTGLALLHTHADIPLNIDKIIDRFEKSGNRRIKLSI